MWLSLIGTLAIYLLIQQFVKREWLPIFWRNGILLLAGFLISEAVTKAGVDIGIRWFDIQEISGSFFFPLIVINSLLELFEIRNPTSLGQAAKSVGLNIALGLILLPAIFFFSFGYPEFYSIKTAALTALILLASDNGMITPFVKKKIRQFLRIESELLTTLLLIGIWIIYSWADWTDNFMHTDLLLAGFYLALIWPFSWTLCKTYEWLSPKLSKHSVWLMYVLLYGGYLIVEHFTMNGLLFTVVIAIIGKRYFGGQKHRVVKKHHQVQETIGGISMVFMGIAFTPNIFVDRWLMILLCIFIYSGFKSILGLIITKKICSDISVRDYLLGSIHGSSAIVLAISIPLSFTGWYTAQAMVLGLVIFEYVVAIPLMLRAR
jgi:hypothetical protein